ncbi:hypothetical protein CMT89_05660 [Elizabethkingia anophelis]|nr:hypothetical protein AL491_14845 [Elizabethkingia anophelis]AVF53271.1 hypothetical protein AL492_17255 [Elizabethkingia anophelis]MCT4071536.1 hypothetical protein [Elizabethkingia anophelis]MDV2458426.1 hypothetical protein [Elizabethkingia anophelis]MDV2466777.1 hypothetical protein [Elizabethkingia anophelis]
MYSYFSYLGKTGRILSSKSQYNDKNYKMGLKKFLLRSIISILIFVTGTTLSYRNDMPKDGYETMGFPLSFYRNNPDPVDMAAKADNLYPWYLVFDFLFAIGLAIGLEKIFRHILRKE